MSHGRNFRAFMLKTKIICFVRLMSNRDVPEITRLKIKIENKVRDASYIHTLLQQITCLALQHLLLQRLLFTEHQLQTYNFCSVEL